MTAPKPAFCVVGLGAHARTKILPALAAVGGRLSGVVTSSPDTAGAEHGFTSLEAALRALPRETVYFVATPPALHAGQAARILSAGSDVLLEKPAFVTLHDARRVTALAGPAGPVLVEAFMYRHTLLFQRLLAFWRENKDGVRTISLRFLIPRMLPGTFRSGMEIADSSLFDIGSYPLSLLQALQIDATALALTRVEHAGQPERERLEITGASGGRDVFIEAGIGPAYVNEVRLGLEDRSICFTPLFYGRPGTRSITMETAEGLSSEPLEDGNAFEAMFAVPRSQWLETQLERNQAMVYQAARLETLGNELFSIRNNNLLRKPQ